MKKKQRKKIYELFGRKTTKDLFFYLLEDSHLD